MVDFLKVDNTAFDLTVPVDGPHGWGIKIQPDSTLFGCFKVSTSFAFLFARFGYSLEVTEDC